MHEILPQSTDSQPMNDDIDLREVLLTLWNRRLFIVACTILGTVVAGIYAFTLPKVFESTILLIPTEAPKPDQLGAAAALLGGKKAGGAGDLDLYQTLLTSRTVIQKLLKTSLRNESDTGKGRSEPLYQIFKLDTTNKLSVYNAVQGLAKSIEVAPQGSGNGGILQVTARASTPWLAQEIADTVTALGQEEIRQVRAERLDALLPRLNLAASQAKAEWDATTQVIARYHDRNHSVILPDQQLELDRLNMERQVMEQKYLLARKEVEQQLLDRAKATPPAVILDVADLPAKKSKPQRSVIIVIGMVFSLGGASAGALIWKAFAKTALA